MSLFERIRDDHAAARRQLQAVRRGADADARAAQFERLKRGLTAHHMVEEAVVYAALSHARGVPAEAEEAVLGHRAINALLERLDAEPADGPGWEAGLAELDAAMRENFRTEETVVFAALYDGLTPPELDELGRTLSTRMQLAQELFAPVEDTGEETGRPSALEVGPM